MAPATLAHALGMRVTATRASGRSGPEYVYYVGLPDELLKLTKDADFVVIEPQEVDYLATRRPAQIARFRALLAEHFEPVGRVDDYRWFVYEVYARRGGGPAHR